MYGGGGELGRGERVPAVKVFTAPVPVPFSCWVVLLQAIVSRFAQEGGFCFKPIRGAAEERWSSPGLQGWPGAGTAVGRTEPGTRWD